MEESHGLIHRAEATTYDAHSSIIVRSEYGTLDLPGKEVTVSPLTSESDLESGESSAKIGQYTQRLLEYKATLEKKSKALDDYTWQKGDSVRTKIAKALKWIFSFGIAPAIVAMDASIYKSALKRHYGSRTFVKLTFDEFSHSSHFSEYRKNRSLLPEDMFEEFDRRYAGYNGENLLERAWRNLQDKPPEHLASILMQYPTYFEARNALRLEYGGWSEIADVVKKEFIDHVYPALKEELQLEGRDEVAILGSFVQAGAHVFSEALQNRVIQGQLPPYRMRGLNEFINKNEDQRMIYQGLFGEQFFDWSGGPTFGENAYEVIGIVDFGKETVDFVVNKIKNPKAGQKVPIEG